MFIQMLADRFTAGGALLAKGTQVAVDDDLAFRWIGSGVAIDLGDARKIAQGNLVPPTTINAAGAYRDAMELSPVWDITQWDDRSQPAGCTWTLDTDVLFNGRPTIRLDIPANTAGTARIGTTGAAKCSLPNAWDGLSMKCAIRSSNLTCVSGIDPRISNDLTLAGNYAWAQELNLASVPEPNYAAMDWIIYQPDVPTAIGTAPAWPGSISGQIRHRFQFPVTSVPTATSVWIGFFGVVKRRKPKLIMSFDDGFASWRQFAIPLLRYYNIPASFHVSTANINANFTASDVQAIHNDASGLFEVGNHGVDNNGYNLDGAGAYYGKMQTCRDWLYSLGIRGDSIHHHAWVQGQRGNDIIAMARDGGFLSCRATVMSQLGCDDQLAYTGQEKWMYLQPSCSQPGAGVSLANLQASVNTATVTKKHGCSHINWHDFGAADSAAPAWSYDKFADACAWLRSQADAGVFELTTYSRATAAASGRTWVK